MSEYLQSEEYREMMEYLVEEIGVERREAEVVLQDGDLFPLIDAGSMFPFEGEEAVAQWEDAADTLNKLAATSYNEDFFDNPALAQCFLEAAIRAEESISVPGSVFEPKRSRRRYHRDGAIVAPSLTLRDELSGLLSLF